jgi:sodium/bile acid cotransporter 7
MIRTALIQQLGVNGGIMRPELFIGKFGVTCIFLLSGVSLELSELKSALANFKLNFLVQAGSFLVWPFLVGVPLTNAIKRFLPNLFPKALLEGILILTCLPTTVNMCVLLTGAADGNVAASLANAVMGNMMGIFTTRESIVNYYRHGHCHCYYHSSSTHPITQLSHLHHHSCTSHVLFWDGN